MASKINEKMFYWEDCNIPYIAKTPKKVNDEWVFIEEEKIQTERFVCNNPKVKKAWLTASRAMNPIDKIMNMYLHLIMWNDERKDFKNPDEDYTEATKFVNEFQQSK